MQQRENTALVLPKHLVFQEICLVCVFLLLCLAPQSVQRQIHCCPCKESAESPCSALTRPESSFALLQGPQEIFIIMWTRGWLARRMLRNFQNPVLPHPPVLCRELPHRVSVERWLYRVVELCKSRFKYASIHGNRCSVQLVLGACLYV